MELKLNNNQKRNIENCFTIEYNLQNFKTQNILKKINSKLKKIEKKDINKINDLENLYKIFQNYCEEKKDEDINIPSNPKDDFYKDIPGRKSDLKSSDRFLKLALKKHQRTKTSLLRETNSNNNYNFFLESAIKNDNNNFFNFYKKNG